MKPAALALITLALTGCVIQPAPTATQPATAEHTEAAAEAAPTCEPVDQATLDRIAAGFNTDGLELTEGYTVPNTDRQNIRFLAANITGPGIDGQPALWATNDDPDTADWDGIITSVDGIAQEFTDWPNGPADDPITAQEAGAQQALNCLG